MSKDFINASYGVSSSGYSSSGTNLNLSSNSPYGTTTNYGGTGSYESHAFDSGLNSSGYTSYVTGGTSAGLNSYESTNNNIHNLDHHYNDAKIYGNSNLDANNSSSSYDVAKLDKLSSPLIHDELLAQEVLAKAGPANTYQRRDHSHDIGELAGDGSSNKHGNGNAYDYSGHYDKHEEHVNLIKIDPPPPLYSASSVINQDPDPIRIVKPNEQNIVYKQQVNIRYLQPPTPPPPAPIIIREKQLPGPPSQPPIIIRQTAPAPPTPPPLTIRERAPTPPPVCEPTIIERPVPAPPVQPRQVIIERVPAPPPKPRPIIYEKWLPYKSTKRPVIVQKVKQSQYQNSPKNVIIEYEKPKAVAIRQVIEEGVFRVDPATYQSASQTNGEIRFVDRITDLPIENSRILAQLNLDSSSSSTKSKELNLENCQELYSQLLGTNSYYGDHQSTNLQASLSVPSLLDPNYYSSSANQYSYSNTTSHNVEYETITTSVPEALAAKIIAEARAAGAITKSSNNEKC